MSPDISSLRLAARLVPWLRAWRAGTTSLDDVITAMTGQDLAEVEQVVFDADAEPDTGQDLAYGLARMSTTPADEIRLALVVPGDARGLPTSGAFTAAALITGEAVIADAQGLVPQVHRHTSGSGDSWQTVTWRRFVLPDMSLPADVTTVGEADLALSETLHEATKILTDLDVAAWDRRGDRDLAGVRSAREVQLPPGFDSRSRRLYARAMLLDRTLRLAETDALGGAVTAFEASARMDALRPLAAACRQAIKAACHARIRL